MWPLCYTAASALLPRTPLGLRPTTRGDHIAGGQPLGWGACAQLAVLLSTPVAVLGIAADTKVLLMTVSNDALVPRERHMVGILQCGKGAVPTTTAARAAAAVATSTTATAGCCCCVCVLPLLAICPALLVGVRPQCVLGGVEDVLQGAFAFVWIAGRGSNNSRSIVVQSIVSEFRIFGLSCLGHRVC